MMLDRTRIQSGFRIAADIGGTFTDVAAFDEASGELRLGKVLSTPDKLVDGVFSGVNEARVALAESGLFFHGTTVVINTLLERTGVRTALLTTKGFRDIYEIGRINRPDSFNLFFQKHQPLIERRLRFEVDERLFADGSVHTPLDMDGVKAICDQLPALGVEAVAILFLHSYRNPAHEKQVRDYVAGRFPDMFVTASHELSQEYREFERTSTTAANAFVGKTVRRYVGELKSHLRAKSFNGSLFIVKSSGGLYSAEEAQSKCIWMMESGPAAGVVGAKALCDELGLRDAIAFDMGGTTAKAGVIRDGHALTTSTGMIGGYLHGLPVQIAMIDISEVGTGGGSIARVAPGGALRVGPQSAGAEPGPACYGRGGTEPTVTDANLVLGRLGVDRFLGGEMKLDASAASTALTEKLSKPLGLSEAETAEGILRIAVNSMANAVKAVTSERGLDPGSFGALIAYGGAGPLHAVAVARELGIRQVLIPIAPGHFAACGMLRSDLRNDFTRSVFQQLSELSFEAIERHYQDMEVEGAALIKNSGVPVEHVAVHRSVDMRYVGQEHAATLEIPLELFAKRDRAGIRRLFDESHERLYGYASKEGDAEIVSVRSATQGIVPKAKQQRIERGGETPPADAARGSRPVHFHVAGGYVDCPTYARNALKAGNRIAGPVLIEEHASTTVVFPGDIVSVDDLGNLAITIGGR
jgi:N-methylhydantoinase A